jgi:hypothetical protein
MSAEILYEGPAHEATFYILSATCDGMRGTKLPWCTRSRQARFSAGEARERYLPSAEEPESWQAAYGQNGVSGLLVQVAAVPAL